VSDDRIGKWLEAVVEATYPLERAPKALARLDNRDVFGQLVIVP
jgi:hypothetical protein